MAKLVYLTATLFLALAITSSPCQAGNCIALQSTLIYCVDFFLDIYVDLNYITKLNLFDFYWVVLDLQAQANLAHRHQAHQS